MYITTEKALVRYDNYLSELSQLFFYLLELISIIFAKIFTFKVIMYDDVLLKFNVMECFVSFLFPFLFSALFELRNRIKIISSRLPLVL